MDRLRTALRGLRGDSRGIVTVEAALLLTLLVLPVGIAAAQFSEPAIAWIKITSASLKRNSDLQEENNRLLRQLLAERANQGAGQ